MTILLRPRNNEPYSCLICGDKMLITPGGLTSHLKIWHSLTVAQYREKFNIPSQAYHFKKGNIVNQGRIPYNKLPLVTVPCQQCGKDITMTGSRYKKFMNKKCNFYCSKECNATGRVNNVLKHPYFRIGKFKDTSIELKLQKILTEHGITFEKHVSMEGHPDIFIKPNICIFADGDYWHNLPGRKERDAAVTATLTDKGYRVLRFWEHDINSYINSCFNTIQEQAYVA